MWHLLVRRVGFGFSLQGFLQIAQLSDFAPALKRETFQGCLEVCATFPSLPLGPAGILAMGLGTTGVAIEAQEIGYVEALGQTRQSDNCSAECFP